MKVSELFERYDTSPKNREYFDDYDEWLTAVHQFGGDIDDEITNNNNLILAFAYDGKMGEFDKAKGEGWVVDKGI